MKLDTQSFVVEKSDNDVFVVKFDQKLNLYGEYPLLIEFLSIIPWTPKGKPWTGWL